MRLIAKTCEAIYNAWLMESLSIYPPFELQLLPSISAPERNIPRILRSLTCPFDELFWKTDLSMKEMIVLKKLSSLKPYEILKVKIPEFLSSIEGEEVDGSISTLLNWEPEE